MAFRSPRGVKHCRFYGGTRAVVSLKGADPPSPRLRRGKQRGALQALACQQGQRTQNGPGNVRGRRIRFFVRYCGLGEAEGAG
jgi:hypothetical protein